MKITDTNKISDTLEKFDPSNQAFPTGRLTQGAASALDTQEWAEGGTVDGKDAIVYYLFSEEETTSEDAENYPWDEEHVNRIEIEDEKIES